MAADEGLDEVVSEYRTYLQRFDDKVGPCEFGAYVKFRGKLVKKLGYDEFEPKWKESCELDRIYAGIMERGDTINDVMTKMLRERCAEFLLEKEI